MHSGRCPRWTVMSGPGRSATAAINDTNAIRPANTLCCRRGVAEMTSTKCGDRDDWCRRHAAGSASESSRSRSRALSTRLPSAILPWLRAGQCELVRHDVASVAPIRQNTVYYAYCHICELVFEQHPDTPLPRAMPGSSRQTRLCVGAFVMTTILALTLRTYVAKVPHLTVALDRCVLYFHCTYVLRTSALASRLFVIDVQELCCATYYYFTVCAIPCFPVLVSTRVYIFTAAVFIAFSRTIVVARIFVLS